MTGQDAVNSAKAFNDALDINGVILTKMDGDARGGAALSIKAITKVPIKFIGVGEKLDRLEEFRPEGMAQRIIGQGDIMSVIEKVGRLQETISDEERQKQAEKLAKGTRGGIEEPPPDDGQGYWGRQPRQDVDGAEECAAAKVAPYEKSDHERQGCLHGHREQNEFTGSDKRHQRPGVVEQLCVVGEACESR